MQLPSMANCFQRSGSAWMFAAGVLWGLSAAAQPVLVQSPLTIGPDDATIAGVSLASADITVSGTTLTINGRHAIGSLVLMDNAVVTHSPAFVHDYSGTGGDVVRGMHLVVMRDVLIAAGSTINASFRGYGLADGPGRGVWNGNGACGASGGGHGGKGGDSNCSPGGGTYDDPTAPADFGSGGGVYPYGVPNAYGGGCVRLEAQRLTLDGIIACDGGGNPGTSGAGAGGSIWVAALECTGTGVLHANGGNDLATNDSGGGGGGGRVLIACCNVSWSSDQVIANGGLTLGHPGAPGTVVFGVGSACPADFNCDGFTDIFDFSDFITCFEGGACPPGRSADFNGDGFADVFDFSDFVDAFELGC